MPTSGPDDGSLRAAVEAFARERLGCGCPDAVFARIDVEEAVAGVWRIGIGGRLLIDVAAGAEAASEDWVRERLAAGRADRDRLGMNRYRLVLATDGRDMPGEPAPSLRAAPAAPALADDRLHLHRLPRPEVEDLLAVCRSAKAERPAPENG